MPPSQPICCFAKSTDSSKLYSKYTQWNCRQSIWMFRHQNHTLRGEYWHPFYKLEKFKENNACTTPLWRCCRQKAQMVMSYQGSRRRAANQNVKARSIPWTHRQIHTPDPYQNAGDPDRSTRLDHRGSIHTRILTHSRHATAVTSKGKFFI